MQLVRNQAGTAKHSSGGRPSRGAAARMACQAPAAATSRPAQGVVGSAGATR